MHDLHVQQYTGVTPTRYQSGDLEEIAYAPIFMNDGMYDQPVLQSYGDGNYQRMKTIQRSVDPAGLLATRQGGFRFDP